MSDKMREKFDAVTVKWNFEWTGNSSTLVNGQEPGAEQAGNKPAQDPGLLGSTQMYQYYISAVYII